MLLKYDNNFQKAEQALLAILQSRPDWIESYRQVGDATLWQIAQINRVTAPIAHRLLESSELASVPDHWRRAHLESRSRIRAYLVELDRLAAWLAKANITLVLLENAALARAVYPCPGCFNFGDLDFLVRKEDIPAIHQLLAKRGWVALADDVPTSQTLPDFRNGRAEYRGTLTAGYPLRLNFQWSLVARRWFKPSREPDVETLMRRSIPVPRSQVRMLCPVDNLFQLALHNSCHTYVRQPGLGLHLDIDRFVRRVSLDWMRFLDRVEHFRVKTSVYFSLAIPKTIFGTPIPDEVLVRLRPAIWKEQLINCWLQRVGLFNPEVPKFSRPGHIVLTVLLYDDLRGLWQDIFPDQARRGIPMPWCAGHRDAPPTVN